MTLTFEILYAVGLVIFFLLFNREGIFNFKPLYGLMLVVVWPLLVVLVILQMISDKLTGYK